MKQSQVTYTQAKETSKGTRVWIEGQKLMQCGFTPGASYDTAYAMEQGRVILTLDSQGKRKVTNSKRGGQDRPIIDLQSKPIAELFPAGSKVRVMFQQGTITIERHHEESRQGEREKAFKANVENNNITTASMFTGGGISTEAIHYGIGEVGIKSHCAWIAESEVSYMEAAGQNCLSIDDNTMFLSGTVEEIESIFYSKVDLLSFSMPCAGFTKAGKAKHKTSEEQHSGTALFGVVNAIKSANPAVCVSENVIEAKDSAIYSLLKAELTRLGYKLFELVLDSSHTDSIENRKRYWLVAISEGIAPETLELPTVIPSGVTINSILDIVPDEMWRDHTYLKEKAIKDKAAGKGFAVRQLLTGLEERCGTIGRFYNKRRSTEPFLTRADGKERLFTPKEHAAVKSIPAYLIEDVATTRAHEILGQSVDFLQPLKLTTHIMHQLRN